MGHDNEGSPATRRHSGSLLNNRLIKARTHWYNPFERTPHLYVNSSPGLLASFVYS